MERTVELSHEVRLARCPSDPMRASRHSLTRAHAPPPDDSFLSLVFEFGPSLPLPDFGQRFTERVANLLGARAVALALPWRSPAEAVFFHDPEGTACPSVLRELNLALQKLAAEQPDSIQAGSAAHLLGQTLAGSLGWQDLAVTRLTDSEGDLLGVLCLANQGREFSAADRHLLLAVAGHAAVTLENGRLFARIEQSKRQWVEIIDAITDFIVVHDESGRILRVNRPLATFLGFSPPELIGRSMNALEQVTGDVGSLRCALCRAGRDRAEEYIHSAQEHAYLISTSRIPGGPEEGLRTIHVLKDVTDRREAERRYRELFNNIQEGLFFSTPEGRFLEVNDALVRMLGYGSRKELLQVDLSRRLYLSPQRWWQFLEAIEKNDKLRNYEVALRRKDGSIIHTLQNIFAVRDACRKVLQYRGLIMDVTEQKTFQIQLQRERDFNTKILDNTQSMILVLDTAGLISYANRRCFEAGIREPDLLGHSLAGFVPRARQTALLEAMQLTLRGQQTDNLELPLMGSRGTIGHFSVNLSPMRDERGSVSSIVVVMTDITDAALLQAKLRHTEKMAAIGQLVSGVAHEVNNPLTAIVGFTDLLLENPEVPEPAKNDLRLILQESLRTKVIVQNLLSFARQMPAQRKPVQINSVLQQTVQLRAYDFASHGVEVIQRLDERLPETIGDSHQLQQVFLNILNNAYDAVNETDRRGRIEIETSQGDGIVEIVFRDNGPGIAYPDRVFEPFFTTKEVGKGTGLGLSICYGIVREHSGEILCYNTPGRPGSTFVVRLPVAAQAASAAAEVSR